MKISVGPEKAEKRPDWRTDSSVRSAVVPTAMIGCPFTFAAFRSCAVPSDTEIYSVWRDFDAKFFSVKGANVPCPTSRVTERDPMSFFLNESKTLSVKCNPAVGAATDAPERANTV